VLHLAGGEHAAAGVLRWHWAAAGPGNAAGWEVASVSVSASRHHSPRRTQDRDDMATVQVGGVVASLLAVIDHNYA